MRRTRLVAAWAAILGVAIVTRGYGEQAAPSTDSAELSADALRAGALAYPTFDEHLRSAVPEPGEVGRHLANPSNYTVLIEDRGEYFLVGFVGKGHPDLANRRGGGWECLVDRLKWRVGGCHVSK
jgi:hypothetical protein